MRDDVILTGCGSKSLNLAATLGRLRTPPMEQLGTPARLAQALVQFGLLSATPNVTIDDLAEATVLREAAYRAFEATAERRRLDPRDAATLNSYADEEPPRAVLHESGAVTRTSASPVRAALAALARDAIDTIGRHSADLHRCEATACSAIFIDESRGKRRRWCSMARCGNRAKAAAFRSRTA